LLFPVYPGVGIKFALITPGVFFHQKPLAKTHTFLNLNGDHDGKKENFGPYAAGYISPGVNLLFPIGIFGINL
jgi:hypothetical protein